MLLTSFHSFGEQLMNFATVDCTYFVPCKMRVLLSTLLLDHSIPLAFYWSSMVAAVRGVCNVCVMILYQ